MNAKECMNTAYRNRKPDWVPVTLGCSEMIPVKKSGINYIEYFWYEKRNLSRDRCDTDRHFGADVLLHSAEGPSPQDPLVTVQAITQTKEEVLYKVIAHTNEGPLAILHGRHCGWTCFTRRPVHDAKSPTIIVRQNGQPLRCKSAKPGVWHFQAAPGRIEISASATMTAPDV